MKKIIAKLAVAAALVGSAAVITAAPASAQVRFGITLGSPGYYGAPYYNSYSCDPYSRFYDPYRCGYSGYSGYGYGPSFYIGGGSRYYGGSYYGGNYRGGGSVRGGGSFHGSSGSHGGGGHRR